MLLIEIETTSKYKSKSSFKTEKIAAHVYLGCLTIADVQLDYTLVVSTDDSIG